MLHEPNLARLIALPLAFAALLLCTWLLGAISIAGDGVKSGTPQSPSPNFERVFIIVLENTDFDRALEAPFLRHLTMLGAQFTNFHAITHPSYPNYLAMATGSSLNVRNDAQQDLDFTSLVDLLEAAGVS